jgi:histidinol-phosphate aminotransferase
MSRFRPEIEALETYSMADETCSIKVNQNEAPWDWPKGLKAEAAEIVSSVAFNRYPPFHERALTAALAKRWELSPHSVLVGNGSNELLSALFVSCLGQGRKVLLPCPTFGLYRQLAVVAGAPIAEGRLQNGGISYDAEYWIEIARRERPALLLLCSPNNPTGAAFPLHALGAILKEAPGLVAVDEAYAEFSEGTARDYLPEADNLVVLRTFSKAWGSAGLRLGYLMAAPKTATQIRKGLLPYNISPVTASLGVLSLRNAALFEARVRTTISERERLFEALCRVPGLTAYPSKANFILVRVAVGAAFERYQALRARGVLVRNVSHLPGLEGCLRLSVGSAEENESVIGTFAEVFA